MVAPKWEEADIVGIQIGLSGKGAGYNAGRRATVRQIAYLEKYLQFDTTADREGAESKLLAKRASLEETARQLVADGVEFDRSDLPRSFRTAQAAGAAG